MFTHNGCDNMYSLLYCKIGLFRSAYGVYEKGNTYTEVIDFSLLMLMVFGGEMV